MFDRGNAPTWLFSFVDLSFLLLIAVTQMNGSTSSKEVDLGEIALPHVSSRATTQLERGASRRWQVRVHPPDASEPGAFELVGGSGKSPRVSRVDLQGLAQHLVALHAERAQRPLLAPHANALAADMLDAVGLLEDYWPSDRRTVISPVSARW